MPGKPEPPIFDDDFVKGASFTEPSARERARRIGWLARWRMARAERRAERHRRRAMVRHWRAPEYRARSRMRTVATTVAVVVPLAFLVAVAWRVPGRGTRSPETTPVVTGAVPALSAANPFEGSPAASYADGAAGIRPPHATAMGGFTARDVATAYTRTERMLVAAALDRKTLLGGSPDAFAWAIGPDERSYFVKNLNSRDVEQRTRWLVVTLAPHTAELVSTTIKVHGTMSPGTATHSGIHGLAVHVDYLFVYPIQRPGAPRTLERLVARVTGEVFFYRRAGVLHLWAYKWSVAPTPVRCDVRDGFIHPAYDDSAPEKVAMSGAPLDPYDQSKPEPKGKACRRAGRT